MFLEVPRKWSHLLEKIENMRKFHDLYLFTWNRLIKQFRAVVILFTFRWSKNEAIINMFRGKFWLFSRAKNRKQIVTWIFKKVKTYFLLRRERSNSSILNSNWGTFFDSISRSWTFLRLEIRTSLVDFSSQRRLFLKQA